MSRTIKLSASTKVYNESGSVKTIDQLTDERILK